MEKPEGLECANRICEVFRENRLLKVHELSSYLYYFRAVYSIILAEPRFKRFQNFNILKRTVEDPNMFRKEFLAIVKKCSKTEKLNFFERDLFQDEILIQKIKKESPLKTWFIGASSALVLALILSGGKIEIGVPGAEIKVEIPSLGEGIKSLKNSFK